MNARHSADADTPLDIAFHTANLSPIEIAAVTAVVTAALDAQASIEADAPTPPSAWQHSQRRLRTPITPGPGGWRGFSADR
ncbi:acyl-CoA carboxylase subunit epsilon [Rathayibacter soli]|uniref:acyl-CoA carboxylase subunit epsilon n=1 Tax=Rathayibacter soli TaxID=3144168 RepID=UPI0027E4D567|nr:acyl-CoA carboxylase subunit epsilon [Glaciibacter superstes]